MKEVSHDIARTATTWVVHRSTIAVTSGRPVGPGQPLNTPIVLASNFREGGEYARSHGTATWESLERAVGELEVGDATAFASGMAAASAIIFALAPRVVVLPSVSYLGVRALVEDLSVSMAIEVRQVDIADVSSVVDACDGADLVWVETPTNPTLDVADVPAIVTAATKRKAKVVVDSTFATPMCAQPLAAGASVVLHSGTKFIGGHSDLLIGLAVTNDGVVHDRLRHARLVHGATPGALEAFLALRGLRTLPLRMERCQTNARDLVARLGGLAGVESVRYPGSGAIVSFVVTGGAEAADRLCAAVELCVPATSLGGVETTIERRAKYAGDSHVDPGLVRMSVGIEHVDDIWHDLQRATAVASA
jgi:cystathionine gamma-synthase